MSQRTFEKGKKFEAEKMVEVQDGAIVSRTLVDHPTGTVTLFAFDKGQALSEHTAPYDALVEIISGKVEISLNGVSQILEQGEWLIMPAEIPHGLRAVESFKMALVMIRS
ncbi:MAG: cupin domain-containing protein [Aminobacterium sp.]|jgi:quercetin dioxygenase-like cupin family protein|uniref:cupin domain-containing protein n=1 Tax=unclassified Aminobacterium TaxID=2685012 RepID=UPI001BCAAB65|nr:MULTISPECIES: cupin domain-containing protein [unclassified Aminobacterium]MDD2207322.1 cupin domain-containing protein [Aminobacterium sp.]MDD3426617.1 cupin domain-containing protein [Aminobacterium sp.]MDD3707385.1 cupin domain-containing protein [Aminobacterium sp.]MDD4229387.1 cupin domain-containing protein [Aminobacterium sp.]MDD4552255.1 cupin domain-containing protein [Aminobacterium sp.]